MPNNITVSWDDPTLERITNLRLTADTGCSWYDVAHCFGLLKDGRPCRVTLPFSQLRKGLISTEIVKIARSAGVFANGLKIFEALEFT